GKVTDRELDIVERTVGAWNCPGAIDDEVEPPIEPQDQMLKVIDKPQAVQSAIYITLRAVPRRHPDYNRLRILIMALGGYFGSRLNQNIREQKGYTYGISAYLAGRKADAFIGINTECATQYTWPIIDEVIKEMKRLHTQLIPDVELNIVKQHIMSDLAKTLDTPFTVAEYVNSTLLFGTYPEYFNDQVTTLEQVTAQELRELARRYLRPEFMRIVVAGDAQALNKKQ
ncbi:MAG: insulinase family protein, partial [Muribaculaceae bacterium]|nr:insulinase family protein [Muribaculaceae bacterium]